MEKKLPSIFANKINKNIDNNKKIYYSDLEQNKIKEQQNNNFLKPQININQKINKIFNSPKYVYKADVTIKLKDKTINKKIIGKNNNNIITIDNELIPISDIEDIEFTK